MEWSKIFTDISFCEVGNNVIGYGVLIHYTKSLHASNPNQREIWIDNVETLYHTFMGDQNQNVTFQSNRQENCIQYSVLNLDTKTV